MSSMESNLAELNTYVLEENTKPGSEFKMPTKRPRCAGPSSKEPAEEYPAGMSPFELLPPEMFEAIMKMAMRDIKSMVAIERPEKEEEEPEVVTDQHNFLVDVIASVSTRFKTLASSKSLWRGAVYVNGDANKLKMVAEGFLNDGITSLEMVGQRVRGRQAANRTKMSADDTLNIAVKCRNLRKLVIRSVTMNSWPTFAEPWTSLKKLYLANVEMGPETLDGVNIRHSLPNLEAFGIGLSHEVAPFVLPELGDCGNLKHVRLGGNFSVRSVPHDLKRLNGYAMIVNCSQESLVAQLDGCLIGGGIAFEMDLDDDEEFKPEDVEEEDDESDVESDDDIQEQLRQLHQENEEWERNKYEGQK